MKKDEQEPFLIRCPECGELSDSIKRFKMFDYLIFIGIAGWWREVTYTCCPKCMKKHILHKCFTYNILTANIMWLIMILPMSIIQLIRNSRPGHSKAVKKIIEEEIQKTIHNNE